MFVCKDCADLHKETFGGNQYSYIKDVHNEQWDDYQLRSICFGGNQPLFTIMKEYQVDGHAMFSKYRHACVNWYRKRHIALMDGLEFDLESNPKPPKDFDERVAQAKIQFSKASENVGGTLKTVGTSIKDNALIGGNIVNEKAQIVGGILSEKGSLLKEKIQ